MTGAGWATRLVGSGLGIGSVAPLDRINANSQISAMALYMAVSPGDNPALDVAMTREFKAESYKIAPGQYFLSVPKMTTLQVSEKLGAQGGQIGRVLIVHVFNYNGWHNKDLWEWLVAQGVPPEAEEIQAAES